MLFSIPMVVKFSDPSLENHATSLPAASLDSATISKSPSSSISTTSRSRHAAKFVFILIASPKFCEPLFAYHTTLPPSITATIRSRSPSSSRSRITKLPGPLTELSITVAVKFSNPSFTYHTILSLLLPVATISISPSPSKSLSLTS